MQTARSRPSVEKRFDFFLVAPSSQSVNPPGYLGRFKTVIGAAYKRAIVTLVERKSCFAVMAKVSTKSPDLVGRANEAKLKPLISRVKTLKVDNSKPNFSSYLNSPMIDLDWDLSDNGIGALSNCMFMYQQNFIT
jgi:hypothetical protein